MAIVSKHCKKFNLRCLCYSKKMLSILPSCCLNQFFGPILNWVFCLFFLLLLILMFPKHSSMFKRLSEFIMKLFPRRFFPVTQDLRPQSPFDFHFAKNSLPKLSPGYATVSKSIVKICQGDLPKVTDLKGSPKGAMNSSFRNTHYIKPSTSKASTEM